MKITLARWRIDSAARSATRGGTKKTLSPRALGVLLALVESEGDVVSRNALLDRVWPDVIVSDESLSQAVAEIRRTLEDKRVIETIPKRGYRLSAPAAMGRPQAPLLPCDSDIDLEAHALCLEARGEMVRCGRGSIERAEALTEEAVDRAPDCARVRAERAIALVRVHTYWSERRHLLHQAWDEAQAALARAPDLALAHSALGYVEAMAGHWGAAERAHRAALARESRDPAILHNAAWYLMSCGRRRAAITYFEQVGDLEPSNIKGYLLAAQLSREAEPARARRNAERALQRAQARLSVDPCDPRALSAAAATMALLGEPYAACAAMDRVDVQESTQAIYHASALAMIGETARAMRLLEELFDHGWRDTYWLDADPSFVALTGDRRFQRVRQRLAA
ncbi:MAG: winged helix-turn-helix domain-containing protein [Pseudomonadota bacterium]